MMMMNRVNYHSVFYRIRTMNCFWESVFLLPKISSSLEMILSSIFCSKLIFFLFANFRAYSIFFVICSCYATLNLNPSKILTKVASSPSQKKSPKTRYPFLSMWCLQQFKMVMRSGFPPDAFTLFLKLKRSMQSQPTALPDNE